MPFWDDAASGASYANRRRRDQYLGMLADALREKGLVPDDGDAGAEARRRVRRMCEEGGDDAWSLSAQVTAVSKLLLEYM